MGIGRNRSIIIICLLVIFSVYSQAIQVYVESDKSTNLAKIWDGFLAAGPTFLLAVHSIRTERKKEKKNYLEKLEKERINNEQKQLQNKEQLEKEWYNQIVLKRTLDIITDYFDYADEQMKNVSVYEINRELKNKRLNCLRKLNVLKIFDEILYTNCSQLLLDSADNLSAEISLVSKKNKNLNLKVNLIKELYRYIKR